MIYFSKNNYWSFGISFHQNKLYNKTEYEFRIDFWKWSIGVVW